MSLREGQAVNWQYSLLSRPPAAQRQLVAERGTHPVDISMRAADKYILVAYDSQRWSRPGSYQDQRLDTDSAQIISTNSRLRSVKWIKT